jgi:hypothetical protein
MKASERVKQLSDRIRKAEVSGDEIARELRRLRLALDKITIEVTSTKPLTGQKSISVMLGYQMRILAVEIRF